MTHDENSLDLFAEDASLTVDALPTDASLASVSTIGTFGSLGGSTIATSGTASSNG
ncbi:thiocillin family RiPP [Streptomyces iconiensis]|uniref:Thiocillin family RiPP n=1 Tax=Streptomyces iconiensis TaxID=1384038 RepID=A0ABT6ZUR5_9ACTN|nr:thiocillin family RiPP [Streptomyces iconiensis]MDJ1132794.1 thiocillin family RiPP [Streptomyces iconiensis]